ncbi:MAG: NYN domain-containing protein [Armatimonadetes bacterium]|nr:NYN domain-containing protein [Armatimonadota bacterium]
MRRSLEELYAEIQRLSWEEKQELAARLRQDLAHPDGPTASVGEGFSSQKSPAREDAPRKLPGAVARRGAQAPALPARRSRAVAEPPRNGSAGGGVPLLIDGCNLLGIVPDLSLGSRADYERLVFLLQDYAQQHPRLHIFLFLDGRRVRRYQQGAVQVRYVAGRPADDSLIALLGELPEAQRRRARVVTADKDLTRRARALGARVEVPLAFYRRIARPEPEADQRDRPLTPDEVRAWEAYFRLPPDERK